MFQPENDKFFAATKVYVGFLMCPVYRKACAKSMQTVFRYLAKLFKWHNKQVKCILCFKSAKKQPIHVNYIMAK